MNRVSCRMVALMLRSMSAGRNAAWQSLARPAGRLLCAGLATLYCAAGMSDGAAVTWR
jgi:hypothetical protein